MIEIVRRTQRNVKHWSSGEMGLRWTAAGMLEAEQQFRKVIGHTDLASSPSRSNTNSTAPIKKKCPHQPARPRSPSPFNHHTRTAVPKFYDDRDILRRVPRVAAQLTLERLSDRAH